MISHQSPSRFSSCLLVQEIVANTDRLTLRLYQTRYIKEQILSLTGLESLGYREAGSSRLDEFAGHGWIAVGDAAIGFDPLSAQGLFNALHTGMSAARVLSQTTDNDKTRELTSYRHSVEQVWSIYKQRRNSFYAQETRWPNTSFWRSAHSNLRR
jgi:flavin-dependent dehydrogenase